MGEDEAEVREDSDAGSTPVDLEDTKHPSGEVDKEIKAARKYQLQMIEKGDWLQKNIPPILALVSVLATFGFFFYLVEANPQGQNREIVLYILGVLSTVSTQIVSYYFGSSAGSKAKQEQMFKLNGNGHK